MSRIIKGIGLNEVDGSNASHLKHYELTNTILSAFYLVYNRLGYGFLEKVYKNALAYELRKAGLQVEIEAPIKVYYDDEIVGEYFADLVVSGCIIVELKTSEAITDAHKAQLTNYLKATDKEIGLVLNFGPKPQIGRKVFDNKYKPLRHPAKVRSIQIP